MAYAIAPESRDRGVRTCSRPCATCSSCAAAGVANLTLVADLNPVANAGEVGAYFNKSMRDAIGDHPYVGDVRGEGMMCLEGGIGCGDLFWVVVREMWWGGREGIFMGGI